MPDLTDPKVADDENAQACARRQMKLAQELAADAHLLQHPLTVPLLALVIAVNSKQWPGSARA